MMFKPKWFMIFHDCFIHLSAYSASPSPTLCVNWGTGTWQPCHAECSHKRAWSRDAAHRETSKLGRAGRKMSVEICRNMSQREKYEKARWIFGRWNLWVGETRGVGRCQQDSAVASGQMWPAPRLLLRETHKSCINLMILPYLAISCHILPSHYPLGCWIFFLLVPVISSSSASLLVQRCLPELPPQAEACLPNVRLGVLQSLDRRSEEFRRLTPKQWTSSELGNPRLQRQVLLKVTAPS